MKTIICSDVSTPLIISINKKVTTMITEVESPQNMTQLIMTQSLKSRIHKYLKTNAHQFKDLYVLMYIM
jgi:hypothetical protein